MIPNIYAFGSVRSLLSTKAIVVSLLDEVASELLDRPLAVREFGGILNHHVDYFYIGCVVSSVSYFAFYRVYAYSSFVRLNDLSVYRNTYSNFRVFLFILILLFTRDIENAI
jgi:hypothetical protein